MVACKFYLQGICKFGDNCKFEHPLTDSSRNAPSILRQQPFAANSNANNVDTNTLVRSVQNDMMNTEKGGQWLLSSYAPFKDKPGFPGFDDRSFEEVRLGFYEAQVNGTTDQYKQQVQMALQDVASKVKVLQNPSGDVINVIKDIYNSAPSNTQFGQTNNFPPQNAPAPTQNIQNAGYNTPPQSNKFNFANQGSKNVFGQQPQPPPASTAPSGIGLFASANQKLFVQQQQQQQQQAGFAVSSNPMHSLFAPPPNPLASQTPVYNHTSPPAFGQGGVFGNQNFNQQNTPFGTPNPSATGFAPPNNSLAGFAPPNSAPTGFSPPNNAPTGFGGSQPKPLLSSLQSSPPFGANQQKPFYAQAGANFMQYGQQPEQNPAAYGQQPQQPKLQQQIPKITPFSGSPFGTPPQGQQQSPFGGQFQSPGSFGQKVNQPFGAQQPSDSSIFALPPQLNAPQISSSSSSIFGGTTTFAQPAPSQQTFGGQQNSNVDESAYSKMEELLEIEIKSFEADKFLFGQIPEKPPALHLCS